MFSRSVPSKVQLSPRKQFFFLFSFFFFFAFTPRIKILKRELSRRKLREISRNFAQTINFLRTISPRYDRKCFHHSLNRSAVISGNGKITEATVRNTGTILFVCFAFRLLPFRLLPFPRLLSQQTKAKVHCNYIRLETSSVYEIILP